MINTGLSFSPTNDANDPNKPKGSGNPVQDAIQLLSFRLPSFLGASAPPLQGAPTALGSQIGGGVVEQWLKRFFGGQGGPGLPGSLPGAPGPVSSSPRANTQYGTPGGGSLPDSGAHIGVPAPVAPPQLAPNTPPAYTPPAPSPMQRSGGSWQDWPDTRLGGGRSQ